MVIKVFTIACAHQWHWAGDVESLPFNPKDSLHQPFPASWLSYPLKQIKYYVAKNNSFTKLISISTWLLKNIILIWYSIKFTFYNLYWITQTLLITICFNFYRLCKNQSCRYTVIFWKSQILADLINKSPAPNKNICPYKTVIAAARILLLFVLSYSFMSAASLVVWAKWKKKTWHGFGYLSLCRDLMYALYASILGSKE